MRVGQGCLVVTSQVLCHPEIRENSQGGSVLRQEESSGGFSPKHLPPWHHEDSGYSSESQETQFLVFLLLPGLSRLRTVNGTKQKQTGAGAGPHKCQREGKE